MNAEVCIQMSYIYPCLYSVLCLNKITHCLYVHYVLLLMKE